MDNSHKQFVDILSAGIRGNNADKLYDNVDWDRVSELADKHKVEGIVYLALRKSNIAERVGSERLNKLKKSAAMVGIKQTRHISGLSYVLSKLKEKGIPLIVLKGLVVRDFYPNPEQRSMSDADILVHKDEVEVVKNMLIEMGYIFLEDHEASHHIALVHRQYPVIEVHWNLFKRDGFSEELASFEQELWHDAIEVKVGEAEVLSLGYEDLALHLCMHMAAHLAATGFGVRQLCDLVLLVEKKGKEINWNEFLEKSAKYGFNKFNLIMFILCRELFNMEIPKEIDITSVYNKKNVQALIDEVFESGVHGKKEMSNQFSTQIAFNFKGKDKNATVGAIKRYTKFIFPDVDNMSEKYDYAKENKLLTPVAWVHHIGEGVRSKDYALRDKISFFTKGASIAVKRNKLLDWMEL